MPNPLVTIAIPTYNRADGYLKEAISCAVSQTYNNIEIIVADNCSADHTEEVVQSFDSPKLRYIRHPKNIGAIPNFNACLKQTRGDYFLMLHDDDQIDGDFVEICMSAADYKADVGIIRTGTRIIDAHGVTKSERPNEAHGLDTRAFFRAWFDSKIAWYLCSTIYNTKGLREIGGFTSKCNLLSDVRAIVHLAARMGRVDVSDVKASFRKHAGELTFAARVKDWSIDFLDILDQICEIVGTENEAFRRQGLRFMCMLNYNRTTAISSPIERFFTYCSVYRLFDYILSPLEYLGWTRKNMAVRALDKVLQKSLQLIV